MNTAESDGTTVRVSGQTIEEAIAAGKLYFVHMARFHGRTPQATSRETSNSSIGYCKAHEKKLYASREAAKSVIRQSREPGMRAYRCEAIEDRWHYGHLSRAQRRGDA